jgi:hypothetical protein
MTKTLSPKTLRRLDIQGFERVDEERLAQITPWLRLAFGMCAVLAILGTALASPKILLTLAVIAFVGALSPVHPFDLIYNYGIRHATGTPPLPRRGAPSRFACGLGAVWLVATAWAFQTGRAPLGYTLGFLLSCVAVLVSTTDICIPSLIFRALFGGPAPRIDNRDSEA